MKLLAAADPHVKGAENLDYLEAFYEFAKTRNPDAIALLGDLSEQGIEDPAVARVHNDLFTRIMPVVERSIPLKYGMILNNLSPYQVICQTPAIAEYIAKISPHGWHERWKGVAQSYLEILSLISHEMRLSYIPIADVLKTQRSKTLVIPGNKDLDLETTVMKEADVHKQSRIIKGFKLSGYGGAARSDGMPLPKGCPSELTASFNEFPSMNWAEREGDVGSAEPVLVSEPRDFLGEEEPDIALLHTPLYGILDVPEALQKGEVPEGHFGDVHFGSPGILEYARTGKTRLFLAGHTHVAGLQEVRAEGGRLVVALSPGCLGKTEVEGGNFAEIELNDETKEMDVARFYQIMPHTMAVVPTALYIRRGRVIDPIAVTSVMPPAGGRILTTDEMVFNAARAALIEIGR
ncbi:MAG TPA: hypothetical protein HA362_04475 [Nanoarchaeota archaeon]|nr:hypothetical protein [Nanoarchaeota archaeon]